MVNPVRCSLGIPSRQQYVQLAIVAAKALWLRLARAVLHRDRFQIEGALAFLEGCAHEERRNAGITFSLQHYFRERKLVSFHSLSICDSNLRIRNGLYESELKSIAEEFGC
jgi:hypothetical protein